VSLAKGVKEVPALQNCRTFVRKRPLNFCLQIINPRDISEDFKTNYHHNSLRYWFFLSVLLVSWFGLDFVLIMALLFVSDL